MFQEFILPMTILYVVIAIIGFAIYKIDKEFKILWEIKEPSPGQILFKHIECIGGVLYVWNLASGRGELDPATGEVKNWGFTPFGFDC